MRLYELFENNIRGDVEKAVRDKYGDLPQYAHINKTRVADHAMQYANRTSEYTPDLAVDQAIKDLYPSEKSGTQSASDSQAGSQQQKKSQQSQDPKPQETKPKPEPKDTAKPKTKRQKASTDWGDFKAPKSLKRLKEPFDTHIKNPYKSGGAFVQSLLK